MVFPYLEDINIGFFWKQVKTYLTKISVFGYNVIEQKFMLKERRQISFSQQAISFWKVFLIHWVCFMLVGKALGQGHFQNWTNVYLSLHMGLYFDNGLRLWVLSYTFIPSLILILGTLKIFHTNLVLVSSLRLILLVIHLV